MLMTWKIVPGRSGVNGLAKTLDGRAAKGSRRAVKCHRKLSSGIHSCWMAAIFCATNWRLFYWTCWRLLLLSSVSHSVAIQLPHAYLIPIKVDSIPLFLRQPSWRNSQCLGNQWQRKKTENITWAEGNRTWSYPSTSLTELISISYYY